MIPREGVETSSRGVLIAPKGVKKDPKGMETPPKGLRIQFKEGVLLALRIATKILLL